MTQTIITVKKINSAENWYTAVGLFLGKKVCGYGTTHSNAIDDMVRDYKKILKLK
jgi:hypothetical protein